MLSRENMADQPAKVRLSDPALSDRGAALKVAASIGGVLAAIGASSCCVVPFALFTVGVGGAWMSNLTALGPYQPIFVVLALAFLAGGYWLVYRRPKAACAEGSYCATRASDRVAKLGLWAAAVLVIVAVAFPYAARLFLET